MAMLNRRMRGAGGMMPGMYTGAGTEQILYLWLMLPVRFMFINAQCATP